MKEKVLLSQINPFVRNVLSGRTVSRSRWVKAYDCRLFYIHGGSAELQIKDETYSLEEGTLVLFSSGIPYEFRHVRALDTIILNFDYTDDYAGCEKPLVPVEADKFNPSRLLAAPLFEDCDVLNRPLVIRNMQRMEELLYQMDDTHRKGPIFYREWNSGALKSALVEILRCYQNNREVSMEFLDRIRQLVQENLSERLTARMISDMLGYHENHINRLMRNATGMTLYQYIIDRRLSLAKILLMEGSLTIAEIAEKTGFEHVCNFSSCFKSKTGMSPSEFRRKHSSH